ncbi:MAG: hypothetical protein J7J92_00805 [Candidatus Aenigmarchaeota archaeon]|nr:hypothetical protein [Candidatus Aenigmarchaeota archaeon]
MNKKITSGLSLAEAVINTSYMVESELGLRELKQINWYHDKINEIAGELKKRVNKYRTVEDVITNYIYSNYPDVSFITQHLDKSRFEYSEENSSCVVCASLFLSLAEKLDYELFENSYLASMHDFYGNGHLFIRKYENGASKNIDFAMVRKRPFPTTRDYRLYKKGKKKIIFHTEANNLSYLRTYHQFPTTEEKKLIFAEIANEAGWIAWDKKRIDDALKYLNYALRFSSLPDIFINKIELLCEGNRIADAIACCKEAIKIAKKNYDPICISYFEEALEDLKHDKRTPE